MASKRWTEPAPRKLNKEAETSTMKELANQYDVSYFTIYTVCQRNLIKPLSEKARWPREVKSFILDNHHLSCKELSQQTGMPQDSIRSLLNRVYGSRWRLSMKSNLSREDNK